MPSRRLTQVLIPVLAPVLALLAGGTAEAKGFIVHEWGTFTTVSAGDGRPLGGLYVDASRLPAFVQGVPFFNYDPASGWAPLSKLRHVTVKMETPVLYFYSPAPLDVEVQVRDFLAAVAIKKGTLLMPIFGIRG